MLKTKTVATYMVVLITAVLSTTVANTMTASAQGEQFLFTFGSGGSGDSQFSFPTGVTVGSANNIIVADRNNHRIQVFDSSGNFLFKFGSGGSGDGQFSFPTGVAVDSADNIIVADSGNNRIQVFGFVPTPTPTPSPTPTLSPLPTLSPTQSLIPSPVPLPSPTVTAATPSPTPTPKPSATQGAKGKMSGFVVDTEGNPIESAKVKAKGVETKIVKKTFSDTEGFFEFADLGEDTYKITEKKKRYKKVKETVKLEEGEEEEITIEMKRKRK